MSTASVAVEPLISSHSGDASWRRIARTFIQRPSAIVGLVFLTVMVALALVGPAIAPHGPNDIDLSRQLQPPGPANLFGTDELGRDVLSRVILGARASLEVSAVSVAIALTAGALLGLLAGFYLGPI